MDRLLIIFLILVIQLFLSLCLCINGVLVGPLLPPPLVRLTPLSTSRGWEGVFWVSLGGRWNSLHGVVHFDNEDLAGRVPGVEQLSVAIVARLAGRWIHLREVL